MQVITINNEKWSSIDQCFLLASVEALNSTAGLGLAAAQVPRAEHPSLAQLHTEHSVCPLAAQQTLPPKSCNLTTTVTDKYKVTYPILLFS